MVGVSAGETLMAGTVVDSLVVTLGLDPSNFTKGQKDAAESLIKTRQSAESVAKEMEAKGKQAAQFFSSVKNEALGLIGVLLGAHGLESFVRQTTTSLVAMGNAARNIGMPIGELAAFGNLVERHGGSAEQAAASFQKLTDAANNFAILGQGSQYASVMSMLGLNPGAKGIDVYSALLKYASTHNDARGIQMTRLWGQMLGLDEGTMNTLFDQVAHGGFVRFQQEMRESMRLGVPTQEMSEAMKTLTHDWEAMRQAAQNFGNVLLTDVQPYLSKFLVWNTEMIEKAPATTLAIEAIASAFLSFATLANITKLFGLTATSEKLAAMAGFLGRISAWAAVLSLSGDTPSDPNMNRPYDPVTNPNFFDRNGAGGRWLQRNGMGFIYGGGSGGGGTFNGQLTPAPASHEDFFRKYMPDAIEAGKLTGIDPRIILAQAALESDWGRHAPGNNMFGIKGSGQTLQTREFINGQWVMVPQQFRTYGSASESFRGYADFINTNQRYVGVQAAPGLDAQLDALQKSGYATAPNYSESLRGIIRQMPPGGFITPTPNAGQIAPAGSGGAQNAWHNTLHIREINVNTQATDAKGIGNSIHKALSDAITDANRGLE